MTTILALETSCDETAVAVVRDRQMLSNLISSQVALHQPYGGIVPELASREHVVTLAQLLPLAREQSGVNW